MNAKCYGKIFVGRFVRNGKGVQTSNTFMVCSASNKQKYVFF